MPVLPELAPLIRRVEATVQDGPSLAEALAGELDVDAVLARGELRDDRYTRVALHVGSTFEVRLLGWRPGQSSAVHGHGNANGAMRVLRGRVQERRLGLADRHLAEGDVAVVEPGVFHQIGNVTDAPCFTLHVYAPPLPVDQPSPGAGRNVVIVGGGWSGVAVAVQLLARADASLRVTLVEQAGTLGRGVAYGAAEGSPHLLNVPAGRMGLDPAATDEFLAYARKRGVPAGPRSLLPRRLYGDYVLDRLAKAVAGSPGKLRLERARVADVVATADGWEVRLEDGRALPAEHVVLASGHGPAHIPAALRAAGVPMVLGTDLLVAPGTVTADERVLLIGTGLTALDVVGALDVQGHRGAIDAVSLTGRWPHRHLPTLAWDGPAVVVDPAALPDTADALAAWIQARIATARAEGVPWQAVVDALRPHIPSLWRRFSDDERRRFLGTYRGEWERMRHRAPASQVDLAERLEGEGRLQRGRGEIVGVAPSAGGWSVTVRSGDETRTLEVDRVIVCTGPSSDPRSFGAPWPSMLAAGTVEPDPHGLGILAGEAGRVSGRVGLWAMGGLLRPRDFESTAVPELARQAQGLAEALTGELRGA